MISTTLFPGRYIQGTGAVARLGAECARLGSHAFLVASPYPVEHLLPPMLPGLRESSGLTLETFGRQCTDEEIERLLGLLRSAGADLVVGVGGGKTLDTAKAVAHRAGVPAIMVPTIASTDAPCSSVCVVYDQQGVFKRADVLPRNPDSVIMDTGLVASASPRFLAAGMGDALATWFEAESCRVGRSPNIAGDVGSATAFALARLCLDILLEYGALALASCESGTVTPALERVVEANTLLSGIGFESAGLAAAHAIHNGFTALEQTSHCQHGEKVAFGTLASLFLTDKDRATVDLIYGFCESVGLPTTLADLGLPDVSAEELLLVAEKACAPEESIHHEPYEISPVRVADMIRAADAWGRKRKTCGA
ncbi:MAG: glycerol dehydrogenase [Desulfovibrionaceae bacterium]